MRRIACIVPLLVGCGPLLVPMPTRLTVDEQATIDRGWNKALTPVNRLSRDTWLDLLVGRMLFEVGVDTLQFHSEKRFSGGIVVMDILFIRSEPDDDRFTMEVRDARGNVLRRETFSRAEVARAAEALGQNGDAAKRAKSEKLWNAIEAYFPTPSPERRPTVPSR